MNTRGIMFLITTVLLLNNSITASQKNPPGTAKVKYTSGVTNFIDKNPTDYLSWFEIQCSILNNDYSIILNDNNLNYHFSCKNSDVEDFKVLIFDKNAWIKAYGQDFKISTDKYKSIVGISKEQIDTFLVVRSAIVNSFKDQKVEYQLLSEDDYLQLISKKWKYLDKESDIGELTSNNTIFYKGKFIPVSQYDKAFTFRCKAIKKEDQ